MTRVTFLPAPFRRAALLLCAAFSMNLPAASQSVSGGRLPTRWDAQVSPTAPLPEYPRPQMVRARWQSLNGPWQYGLTDSAATIPPPAYGGKILVPYPYEAALSGVGKPSIPGQRLWYRRTFTVPSGWRGRRVLLHFGAVNWDSTVAVNGKKMGEHKGGYDGFDYDITSALKPGANELVVSAWNPVNSDNPAAQIIGKQRLHPGGVLYTACTGIWQSVWLEPVFLSHIADLKITPDIDAKALRLTVHCDGVDSGAAVAVTVTDGKAIVARTGGAADEEIRIPIPRPRLWSPDDPHLYGLRVTLPDRSSDTVGSYFAMRKISLGKDTQGRTCVFLNNKYIFQVGALDQGYWPDGIYTAPTDNALRYDIEEARKLGFNLLRKHAKVEPDRWYYWTDKLGMLVWQDMPQAFGDNFTDETKQQWLTELKREIATHANHPSIIAWTLFNEGWGQHDTEQITNLARQLDPARLINSASGGYNQLVNGKPSSYRLPTPSNLGDINDTHTYPDPSSEKQDPTRALVCGEFGGVGLRAPGHLWSMGVFGYGAPQTGGWELTRRYQALLKEAYGLRETQGTCAFVYTQIADVEEETNGLMTYDRAVLKPLPAIIRAANRGQFPPMPPAPPPPLNHDPLNHDPLPTSENTPQTWQYLTVKPAGDWMKPGFDSSAWISGHAPFGHGYKTNTDWTTDDIWLRRDAMLPDTIPAKLDVVTIHDEDVEVYVNGVLAASAPGFVGDYVRLPMSDTARAALKPGKNLIAVHCHQTLGGQVIDVGLAEAFTLKATIIPWKSTATVVAWKSSTPDALWHDNAPLAAASWDNRAAPDVTVDPVATYQGIDGWGGCFNERGWAALSVLSPPDRERVLRALFDGQSGLKLNICRSPIGASDYAITPYSLDDTDGNVPDCSMSHFSIARDQQKLIPFIKAALAIRPGLKIWGVPWSPPVWMKTNKAVNTDNNGFMRSDPQTMTAYALYFEKYVQAYQRLGIPVFMVAPQNEPTQATGYPGCFWTGEELRDFLVKYLGPKLKTDGIKCQTWLGTPTNERRDIIDPTLNDPSASQYVTGYGLQYSADKDIPAILRAQPAAKIMETETPCGNHENDWLYAEGQFRTVLTYLTAGANSYMLWNMVLDQNGSNWSPKGYDAGWHQNSPVVIDLNTKSVTYTPQYYVFKHFSYFVQPGAHRVDATGSYGDKIAFRNPNNDLMLMMQNSSNAPITTTINLGGKKITPTLPPHSWNTFTLASGSHVNK